MFEGVTSPPSPSRLNSDNGIITMKSIIDSKAVFQSNIYSIIEILPTAIMQPAAVYSVIRLLFL